MQIYSVTQVNNYIKLLLNDDVLLNQINIEGEVSNLKIHSSGNIYFKINDSECTIDAIIYKFNNNISETILDNILFTNGVKVICSGYISSYPKYGKYQIIINNIDIKGSTGLVLSNFNQLKEKLFLEGLFDSVHKKCIPTMPQNIAIITSPTGAAIQDIINVAKRRNPLVKIILIPTIVQGEEAHINIIKAINTANSYNNLNLDTIILARGGGSTEDLECFNNEDLARAIFNSNIPIVTGIGHEIDFTIADFVSDLRASTPSMACEVCIPEVTNIIDKLENYILNINNIMFSRIQEHKVIFNFLLNDINQHISNTINYKISNNFRYIQNKVNLLDMQINKKVSQNKYLLDASINKMETVSPTNILKNGYSIVSKVSKVSQVSQVSKVSQVKTNENIIKNKSDLKTGDLVDITLSDGSVRALILEK